MALMRSKTRKATRVVNPDGKNVNEWSDGTAPPSSAILSFIRICAYLAVTLLLIPAQALAHLISRNLVRKIPVYYHRLSCRILGLRLNIVGKPALAGTVLFVANHCSYLDIEVYGAVIEGSFVAKKEVASWPVFGLLARLQRSVFVDRSRTASKAMGAAIRDRLQQGGNVILFPEGTSNDGNMVIPFRSSLLAAVDRPDDVAPEDWRDITVQPVTLTYTHLDGLPIGRSLRPYIAWYGDMDMASHFFRLFGLGRVSARIEFHRPVGPGEFASRKELTDHCYKTVADGHANALASKGSTGRMLTLGRRL